MVKGNGPSLLGITQVRQPLTQANPKPQMSYKKQMEALLETHKAVFQEGLGETTANY